MADITVCVQQEDAEEVEGILQAADPNLLRAESRGVDGKLLVELVIVLTPLVVPLLIKLHEKRLAANRYIQFKYKGLEVKGVSESTLLKLIDRAGSPTKKP